VKTGDAKLTVVWNAVKRAKTYILYYNTQDNRDSAIQWSEEIDRAAGTLSARITGLANETQYYVWVEAKNSAGTRVSPSAYEIPHAKRPLNFNNPNTVIGTASARFPNEEAGKGDRLSRKQETAFGDLVCESMTAWARSNGHAVDFAFINGGVIQGAIPKGSITIGMLNTLLYGDQLSIVTLRGNKVQELFEYVASIRHTGGGGSGTGAFGQVSKEVRYTINYTYSADHINGVLENFTIGGSAVDPNRNYTFITSTYLVDGGDGYGAYLLSDLHVPTGLTLYKAVAEYIYDQDGVPLVPATDGRIVLIGAVWTGAQ
jgi:2',3'-cyclic-nucleotide 2'-phosphodiesterase (5'-nucleotidase family)